MTAKQRMNDLLERVSGRRVMRPSYIKVGDLGGQVEPDARVVLDQVAGRTITVPLQQYNTWTAVRYLVQNEIEGAIVECRTWRGGQAMIAALTLLQVHARETLDLSVGDRTSSENMWCVADERDVRAGMKSTSYPVERILIIPGLVEDTIPDHTPTEIALLRLDTDWYESTRHELEHLWDRVVPNGVVVVDDYDWWAGSRCAVDEFLAARGVWPMLFRPGMGRALIKPANERQPSRQ